MHEKGHKTFPAECMSKNKGSMSNAIKQAKTDILPLQTINILNVDRITSVH